MQDYCNRERENPDGEGVGAGVKHEFTNISIGLFNGWDAEIIATCVS